MKSSRRSVCLVTAGILCFMSVGLITNAGPSILGRKAQGEVLDQWLGKRLDTILPEIMRRENVDMWVVISRENNEDPVFLSLVPSAFLASWRTYMLVFFDRGDGGIERISVSRMGAGNLYKEAWEFGKMDQWTCLGRVIRDRRPRRIAVDESPTFSYADGLTASLRTQLESAIGPEYSSKLCSAENLVVGWLERRIPAEVEVYSHLASLAHSVLKEALSRRVITPGVTTTDDLSFWLWDKNDELHLHTWAQAGVSVQRPKDSPYKDSVIRGGDLVHIDYVFDYLHLGVDTKACAYVLKAGETEVPRGLRKALEAGNRVQDILLGEFKEGLTGNQVLASALRKVKEAGLKGTILCHPVGFYGHGAGPMIGQWDNQVHVAGAGDYLLYADTCHAIELTATSPVPEWGNQEVTIELEEDAVFRRSGVVFLDGRQTSIIAIK